MKWSILLAVVCSGCFGHATSAPRDPATLPPARPPVDHATFAASGSRAIVTAAARHGRRGAPLPPLALSADDGSGLRLARYEAAITLEGPLALTELQLGFENPEAREREGRFRIRLPPGAALSRLAMRIGDAWQEAEVLERARARAIYEGYLHLEQDPALLERGAGNEISARVFPIPANGIKEIRIAYTEQLPSTERPYRLELTGLPEIGHIAVRASVRRGDGRVDVHRFERENHAPTKDFELLPPSQPDGLEVQDLSVMRIRPRLPAAVSRLERLTILVDSSASRAREFVADVERVWALARTLAREHGGGLELELVAFDQRVARVFRGPIGELGERERATLLERLPLGASDLGAALEYLQSHPAPRALFFTDAVPSAGRVQRAELQGAARALRGKTRRIDVVLARGRSDPALARALVSSGLDEDGMVLDAEAPIEQTARRLGHRGVSGLTVAVPGADFVHPRVLDGAVDGEEVLILARGRALGGAGKSRVVELAGAFPQTFRLQAVSAPASLVERAVAMARIEALEAHAPLDSDRVAAIVELAKRHRLATAYTSFLVLETDAEYARHGIERTAPEGDADLGRAFESAPAPAGSSEVVAGEPRDPTTANGRGYGYEFADDPLSVSGHAFSRANTPARERAPEPPMFDGPPPLTGRFADIFDLLAREQIDEAVVRALDWVRERPSNLLALVALGRALEQRGERVLAARAYGGVIDLYPDRAELRRFAAGCLERLGEHGLPLALDSLQKALADRPDHLTGYHLLALALLRAGRPGEAIRVLEAGIARPIRLVRSDYPKEVLRRDLEIAAAAYVKHRPAARGEILDRLEALGLELSRASSVKFVLTWETDANDADLHVVDRFGQRAYYEVPRLASGGRLLEDVRAGYGPELFDIPGTVEAGPYRLGVHYFARGPMGYGLGNVDVVAHDGYGNVTIENRPFVVMNDGAFVSLGFVR